MSRTHRHSAEDDEGEDEEVCRRCGDPLAGNEGFTVGLCSDCEDEMESEDYDPEDEDDDFDFDFDLDDDEG